VSTASAAIGLLRVRSAGTERAALRLAVARQLGTVDLAPAALPPSAVLVVRRLADPLPGRVGAHPSRFRAPADWERALADRLDEAAAHAARPGTDGRLPPRADSVLFADPAELIACLVLDKTRGAAAGRWWWEHVSALLPTLGAFAAAPARVLAATARELPAVFAVLDGWRAAGEVGAALDGQGTRAVLDALARAYALDARVLGPPALGAAPPLSARVLRDAGNLAGVRTGRRDAAEPWRPWLPAAERTGSLAAQQRCLLGLALGLHAAPARVRGLGFADQAEQWWRQQTEAGRLLQWQDRFDALTRPAAAARRGASAAAGASAPTEHAARDYARGADAGGSGSAPASNGPVPASAAGPLPGCSPDLPDTLEGTGRPGERPSPMAAPVDASGLPEPTPFGAPATMPRPMALGNAPLPAPGRAPFAGARADGAGHAGRRRLGREQGPEHAAPGVAAPEDLGADRGGEPSAGAGLSSGAGPLPAMQPVQAAPQPRRPAARGCAGEQVATRLGGVLYLIHALAALRIPAAFEDAVGLASRIGPWGALDLIARALLGAQLGPRWAEYAEDPLWPVLAALSAAASGANQAEQEAGVSMGFAAAAWPCACAPAYRAPPHWPAALADAVPRARWAEDAGCLWLWSDAGYLLAALPRDDRSPAEQARAVLSPGAADAARELRPGAIAALPLAPPVGARADADLLCWAAAAAPAVARRLRLALGDTPDAADPLHRLLSVPGVLYLSASHVDLVTDLNQIWLPARRAGLDRNPGWLPEYGRVVLFHYR
jgi:hypothetical protein